MLSNICVSNFQAVFFWVSLVERRRYLGSAERFLLPENRINSYSNKERWKRQSYSRAEPGWQPERLHGAHCMRFWAREPFVMAFGNCRERRM